MPETGYNGWSNRATWNANLWLSNEEGLNREVNRLERRHMTDLKDARDSVKSDLEEAEGEYREAAEADVADWAAEVERLREKLAEAETALAEGPDDSEVEAFAEAIKAFCRDLWPNNETPDGDALSEVDWEEIARAWIEG